MTTWQNKMYANVLRYVWCETRNFWTHNGVMRLRQERDDESVCWTKWMWTYAGCCIALMKLHQQDNEITALTATNVSLIILILFRIVGAARTHAHSGTHTTHAFLRIPFSCLSVATSVARSVTQNFYCHRSEPNGRCVAPSRPLVHKSTQHTWGIRIIIIMRWCVFVLISNIVCESFTCSVVVFVNTLPTKAMGGWISQGNLTNFHN